MHRNIHHILKNGMIAGVFSGSISSLLNYYLLPFPTGALDNAVGHGIGGFFCGAISAAIGTLLCTLQFGRNGTQGLS